MIKGAYCQETCDFVEEGHRVIQSKLIKYSKIDLNAGEERFVNKEIIRNGCFNSCRDDVILTSEAPLGKVAYVKRIWIGV